MENDLLTSDLLTHLLSYPQSRDAIASKKGSATNRIIFVVAYFLFLAHAHVAFDKRHSKCPLCMQENYSKIVPTRNFKLKKTTNINEMSFRAFYEVGCYCIKL